MTKDVTRRTFLGACAAAPVAVPAAVVGALKAAQAAPVVEDLWFTAPPIDAWEITFPPAQPISGVFHLLPEKDFVTSPTGMRWQTLDEFRRACHPEDGDTRTRMICNGDVVEQRLTERLTNGQWLKVEDPTAEADLAQAEGHSPDVLDEDCAAFTVAV